MVGEAFAGLSALKTAFDLAKGLKDINDATIRNGAIIELQEKILAAREQQSALLDRVPLETKAMPLEIDASGMVITRPVLGWTTVTVAESSVILQMQYAETPQELKTGGRSIQFVLTPPQSLELAETLTKQAKRILNLKPSNPPN